MTEYSPWSTLGIDRENANTATSVRNGRACLFLCQGFTLPVCDNRQKQIELIFGNMFIGGSALGLRAPRSRASCQSRACRTAAPRENARSPRRKGSESTIKRQCLCLAKEQWGHNRKAVPLSHLQQHPNRCPRGRPDQVLHVVRPADVAERPCAATGAAAKAVETQGEGDVLALRPGVSCWLIERPRFFLDGL